MTKGSTATRPGQPSAAPHDGTAAHATLIVLRYPADHPLSMAPALARDHVDTVFATSLVATR